MVGTFIRSDQRTDVATAPGSTHARIWTLTVACAGVSLVIASMVALNTALGDIAMATSATQSQLTWVVDGYTLLLACLLLPAGAIGDRYGRRGALLVGLAIFAVASVAPTVLRHTGSLSKPTTLDGPLGLRNHPALNLAVRHLLPGSIRLIANPQCVVEHPPTAPEHPRQHRSLERCQFDPVSVAHQHNHTVTTPTDNAADLPPIRE
jgi:hypothetical protein